MDSNKLNKLIIAIVVFIIIIIIILINKSGKVKDTAKLELYGSESITLNQYDNYVEFGYKIVEKRGDDYHVNKEGKVDTTTPGVYSIKYSLYNNKDELLSTVTRKIYVLDDNLSKTKIILKGEETEYYFVGDYVDHGFEAYRDTTNIKDMVRINNTVNNNKVGRYTVEYYIVSGNSRKSVTREVYIVDLNVVKSISKADHIIKLSINTLGYDHVVLPNNGTNKSANITYKYAVANLKDEYNFDIYLKSGSHRKYTVKSSELGADKLVGTCSLAYANKKTFVTINMSDISLVSKFRINGEDFTSSSKIINGYKSSVTVKAYNFANQVTTITCNGTIPTPTPIPATPIPTPVPTPTVVRSIVFVQGYDNRQTVCKTLVASGFSKNAVAGMMANIERESGFNTNSPSDSETSNGLFQWHRGRLQRLQNFCGSQYLSSIKCQLEYFLYEITSGTERECGVYEYLMGNHSAYDMGYQFSMLYERPGGMEKSAAPRGELAQNVYLEYVNNGCN